MSEIKIDFEKSKAEKKILSGLVVSCEQYKISALEVSYILVVNCHNTLINIGQSEIPELPARVGPKNLIGENVNFTIIDINDGIIMGSIKEAEAILKKPILEKLYAGEVMTGVVTYITPWGAYVTIGGVVSGIMKNFDFADDGTEIWKVHKKYSKIKVKYKKTTNKGTIVFLPEKKKLGKVLYNPENIKPGDSFLGKVTDVSLPAGMVRVIIDSNNLIVRCVYPKKFTDIKIGNKVVVTISKVKKEENYYSFYGKIMSRVDNGGEDKYGRR